MYVEAFCLVIPIVVLGLPLVKAKDLPLGNPKRFAVSACTLIAVVTRSGAGRTYEYAEGNPWLVLRSAQGYSEEEAKGNPRVRTSFLGKESPVRPYEGLGILSAGGTHTLVCTRADGVGYP